MSFMKNVLIIIQMVLAVLVIVAILAQNRGGGLSGVFGGSGAVFRAKRGMEKTLHIATIIFTILFLGLSLVIFII